MDNENKNETVLASTNPETNNNEPGVIKATELQDNINVTEKKDLSAIIPQESIKGAEASNTLLSRETTLKSDGAVVIGNIEADGIKMIENATFPKEIDIAKRKKEQQESLKIKKNPNKKKKVLSDEGKKAQNITTIIVLVVIAFLGAFAYFFINRKTDEDFVPKIVTIELGNPLPLHAKDYVKPGVGKVDDLLYTINTSEVRVDEVGDYEFTVYHSGTTKRGTVSIVDTTPPKVETKELHIVEGSTYTPESFITKCLDLSGCEYSFKEDNLANFTKSGLYNKDNNNLIIIVKDPFDNKIEVGVTLYIESSSDIKKYKKEVPFNEALGYSLITTYELHFRSFGNTFILSYADIVSVYSYQSEVVFNSDVQKHEGEKGVSHNSIEKTITITEKTNSITPNGGNTPSEIESYLATQGYIKTQ